MTDLHCAHQLSTFLLRQIWSWHHSKLAAFSLVLAASGVGGLAGCHNTELADIDPAPAIPRGAPPA